MAQGTSRISSFILGGLLLGTALGASIACGNAEEETACKAKFVKMLEPCVDPCAVQSADGNASDTCIRECVQQTWGEPVPSC